MDAKKSIMIINTTFTRGGAAAIARELYYALKDDPVYDPFFLQGRESRRGEILSIQGRLGSCLHGAISLLGFHGHGSYLPTRKAIKVIREKKVALIHLHNIHGYFLNFKFIRWLKQVNIPTLWTLHDAWPVTGRCAYFFECEKWLEQCGGCPDLSSYPRAFFDFSKFNLIRKKRLFTQGWEPLIVTPSNWLREILKKSYLARLSSKTIYNGIDLEVYAPLNKLKCRGKFGISRANKVILFLADDISDPRKGLAYLLEAVQQVNQPGVLLIIAGGCRLDKSILSRLSAHRYFGRIRDQKKIVELYNSSDVYVISSIQDTLSNTVLEAMACGVPVVGFRSGGITEQVDDQTGILVEKGNIKSLAAAIDKIVGSAGLRKRLSAGARRRIKDEFSLGRMVSQYKDLYQSLMRRSSPGS